jgi:putative ABC transport system substrate-binding protein
MLRSIPTLCLLGRVAFFAWFGCAAMATLVFDVHAAEIVVLKSSDVGYYTQAVQGFRQALPAQAHIVEYTLRDGGTDAREVGQSIRAGHPDLVLAVGLNAALAAKLEIPDLPVVFCLVLNPELHGLPADNMTGVLMKIPHQQQLESIKSVAPRARRIGLLVGATHSIEAITTATGQAKSLGLHLITATVSNRAQVPEALKRLLPQIDLLWLLPDQMVITEELLPFLLRSTLDAKIPLFGFSSTLVQRGALGALVIDPVEAGQQAGRLATARLRTPSKTGMQLVPPDRAHLALNLNTADYLDFTPPPDIVRMASHLFGGPGTFAATPDRNGPIP